MADLLKSPLYDKHEALGASFTAFGDWNMPLKYGKELEEHRAVRERAGLFDLSHMGEVRSKGAQAGEFLNYSLVGNIKDLEPGQAKYSMAVKEDGGILDDLITYKIAEDEYLTIPNAANTDKIVKVLQERAKDFDVEVVDESKETAMVALQGPVCEKVLLTQVPEDQQQAIKDVKYYAFVTVTVAGIDNVMVARTGYTGEDGFELYVPNDKASPLWDALLEAGKDDGVQPAGLAARDSLRLEAAMPLYGHELTEDLTPVDRRHARRRRQGQGGRVLREVPHRRPEVRQRARRPRRRGQAPRPRGRRDRGRGRQQGRRGDLRPSVADARLPDRARLRQARAQGRRQQAQRRYPRQEVPLRDREEALLQARGLNHPQPRYSRAALRPDRFETGAFGDYNKDVKIARGTR